MKDLRWPLFLVVLFGLSSFCVADSVNFVDDLLIPATGSGATPYFFPSSSVSVNGITVTAWSFSITNGWNLSMLTGRNDVGSGVSKKDFGLGVCTERFDTACGKETSTGDGRPDYFSELDNLKNYELLQISMADGTKGNWSGIDLSSLDQNGAPGGTVGDYAWGQVYYSDTALTAGNMSMPVAFATLLCNFSYDTTKPFPSGGTYGCDQHPTPDKTGKYDATVFFMNGTQLGAVNSSYLYIMAKNVDQGDPPFAAPPYNDFLLKGVVFEGTNIPEPASLLLMASGLGVMSWVSKRKSRG